MSSFAHEAQTRTAIAMALTRSLYRQLGELAQRRWIEEHEHCIPERHVRPGPHRGRNARGERLAVDAGAVARDLVDQEVLASLRVEHDRAVHLRHRVVLDPHVAPPAPPDRY